MNFSTVFSILFTIAHVQYVYADCDGERIPCGDCVQKSESCELFPLCAFLCSESAFLVGGCSWCSTSATCQGPADFGVACEGGGDWKTTCAGSAAKTRGWQSVSYCTEACGIPYAVVINGVERGGKCCANCRPIEKLFSLNGVSWTDCVENGPPPTPVPPTPVPPTPMPPTPVPPTPSPPNNNVDGESGTAVRMQMTALLVGPLVLLQHFV